MTTTSELIERAELESLEKEYQWFLTEEVAQVMKSLDLILKECAKKFPMPLGGGSDRIMEVEKFILSTPSTSPTDQVKVVVTLNGDAISHADINLKLPRQGNKDLYQNTSIREDSPWRLQQLQDSGNHLQLALDHLHSVDDGYCFKSVEQLGYFIEKIIVSLQHSRSALINPKKRTLEELQKNKNVKGFQPAIPSELALSFYIQSWKLVFAVYHIITERGVSKYNRYQAESVVPWLNEVLLLLTIGLQTAQQLKDKIHVFQQYQDLVSV